MSVTRQLQSNRGFTMIEMLVATMIMMAVTGAVFGLMNPAQGTFQAQPEVSDMQQRLRVAVDTISKDLVMAGAGTYQGVSAGALYNSFAPVMPYRSGGAEDDPDHGVLYRTDTISVVYVPSTPAQTTITTVMPANSTELDVKPDPACPDVHHQLCGFKTGMRVLILDQVGDWDAFTVTSIDGDAAHLLHAGQPLSVDYPVGSTITQAVFHTYYLNTVTHQLMHFDGDQTDLPVIDNVVGLSFEYFGEPQPPQLLPNKPLTDPKGPWTTYGPKPPALGVDNAFDSWPAGENCAFAIDVDGKQSPRVGLDSLAGGVTQVKLNPAIFQDGPFCPDGARPVRFDADLLRVRRVRVTIRVQAALASMRGSNPEGRLLFVNPGRATSAERYIPDQVIRFDIAPRNLNLGR